jgi:hypothetical protein
LAQKYKNEIIENLKKREIVKVAEKIEDEQVNEEVCRRSVLTSNIEEISDMFKNEENTLKEEISKHECSDNDSCEKHEELEEEIQ